MEIIARDPQGQAAVASATAAESRGVPILARGIQDRRDNATRFFVIAKTANTVGAKDEVTSVVLTLKHEPGALQGALAAFSDRGINLIRIESRPSHRRAWEYLFFIDFAGRRHRAQGSLRSGEVAGQLSSIRRMSRRALGGVMLAVLGVAVLWSGYSWWRAWSAPLIPVVFRP
ncbi:MAG: hypothetical protein RL309_1658, partial [Verrucomicrobiota bacterium]